MFGGAAFVAVSALVPGSLAIAEGSPVAPSGDPAGSRVTIEVLPQMEILAAPISQTWVLDGVRVQPALFPRGLTDWGSTAGGDPRFSTGSGLTTVTLHDLYDPVASVMKRQAYGEPMTFFNEQVLRSAVTLAVPAHGGRAPGIRGRA